MAKVLALTVEACIDNGFIVDPDSLIKDLEGEVVKVKSGAYENLLTGNITGVEIIGEAEDQFPFDEDDPDRPSDIDVQKPTNDMPSLKGKASYSEKGRVKCMKVHVLLDAACEDITLFGVFTDENLDLATSYVNECCLYDDRYVSLLTGEIDYPADIAGLQRLIRESKEEGEEFLEDRLCEASSDVPNNHPKSEVGSQ